MIPTEYGRSHPEAPRPTRQVGPRTASTTRAKGRKDSHPENGEAQAKAAAGGASALNLTARECEAWLGHQAEATRLSLEWGQVEARLQAEHGWYGLSPQVRADHPGQAELDTIQARLDELDVARDELLPTLAGLPATTRDTVALKLAVAAELVDVADFPEAHALIVRAREEMLAL